MFNELFWMAATGAAQGAGETTTLSYGQTAILVALFIIVVCVIRKRNHRNAVYQVAFKHLYGLPLPSEIECSIRCSKNTLYFEHGGQQFTLSMRRITNMTVTTTEHIKTEMISDVGAAIGGAMDFGSWGAYAGGAPQVKSYSVCTNILFISYQSEEGLEQILFDVAKSPRKAKQFVKRCRKRYTAKIETKEL